MMFLFCKMKRIHLLFLFNLFSHAAISAETITFKQGISPKISWLNYGLIIIVLLLVVLAIAKKHKPGMSKKSDCQLIEKKYLGNKTVVYVFDYQKQRFLLADNQHAIAIHPLQVCDSNEQI